MDKRVIASSKGLYELYTASDDNICRHCNSVLRSVTDYVPYGDTYVPKKTLYCPNCG